jgi:transcriptional regulator with XRE-family HTH domain
MQSLNNAAMKAQVLLDFGKVVRTQRMQLRLSQEQLAERAELHRTYIGMIERAEKNITLVNVEKLAKALGLEIHQLFTPER